MNSPERTLRSRYMEWAKTRSQARYNLATSGIMNVSMAEFPLAVPGLEITAGGYGYEPLQQRIARHNQVAAECVVAAAGTSMANHLAMAALLSPGDEVVIEEPGYGPLLDVAHYLARASARCSGVSKQTSRSISTSCKK